MACLLSMPNMVLLYVSMTNEVIYEHGWRRSGYGMLLKFFCSGECYRTCPLNMINNDGLYYNCVLISVKLFWIRFLFDIFAVFVSFCLYNYQYTFSSACIISRQINYNLMITEQMIWIDSGQTKIDWLMFHFNKTCYKL